MKFRYYKVPIRPTKVFPEHTTLVPLIPIRMLHNTDYFDCYALIDSGASTSLFPAEYGENIGIKDIINDRKEEFSGVGNGHITTYFHDIDIEVGGHKYKIPIGFTYDNLRFPILGQIGFFNLFVVIFDLSREIIELKTKI